MQLKVLTLNVWALPMGLAEDEEARVEAIARRLFDLEADILGFQEVWTEAALRRLAQAGRDAGYPEIWHRPPGFGSSGLLVLSRLPIVSRRFIGFRVEGLPERIDHGDYHGGKGFALLELATPTGPIHVLDTHLHARYAADAQSDPYRAMRVAQVVQIAAATRNLTTPLIALGDFNLREGEIEYTTLLGLTGWVDAAARLDRRQPTIMPDNTYRNGAARDPGQRIDYIFTRDGTTRAVLPLDVRRVFDETWSLAGRQVHYSDHAGVEAFVEIGGNPRPAPPPRAGVIDRARRELTEGLQSSRQRENLQLGGAAGLLALSGASEIKARRVQRRTFLRLAAVLGFGAAGALTWVALGPSSEQVAGFEAALADLASWEDRTPA